MKWYSFQWFFFFSSRRRHTRSCLVSWARRCVQETGYQRRVHGNQTIKKLKHDELLGQKWSVTYYFCPVIQDISSKEFNQTKKQLTKYSSSEECWNDIMKEVLDKQSQFNLNIIEYILQFINKELRNYKKQHKIIKLINKMYCQASLNSCLLYTSDAADDMQCVDLGGRRIIKKKKKQKTKVNIIIVYKKDR
eukprot:TRINITY_DN6417_c0_g1_i4.p1 TRINITY_DN6417_c0_g1~~TRINITY_DN6417_c0_g1_i4.p1  ORF type:complete len:192 (-),score=42.93 TRINITY_DN6417_c0_g1_i4:44-619(-)